MPTNMLLKASSRNVEWLVRVHQGSASDLDRNLCLHCFLSENMTDLFFKKFSSKSDSFLYLPAVSRMLVQERSRPFCYQVTGYLIRMNLVEKLISPCTLSSVTFLLNSLKCIGCLECLRQGTKQEGDMLFSV